MSAIWQYNLPFATKMPAQIVECAVNKPFIPVLVSFFHMYAGVVDLKCLVSNISYPVVTVVCVIISKAAITAGESPYESILMTHLCCNVLLKYLNISHVFFIRAIVGPNDECLVHKG